MALPPKEFHLRINGDAHTITCDPSTPLLFILRNDLGLVGTRQGCTTGHCGACTVQQNGKAVQSCTLPVSAATGEFTTIEGLDGPNQCHPLRQIFLDHQAAQCGYCINGILMSVHAITAASETPDPAKIQEALSRHLCRCGTHHRILAAIEQAVQACTGQASGTRSVVSP